MECNLSFPKHPNQLTRPTSFPNKPCAASSTFSAETTKLAALWFAVEPWELYFIIRHSLAYRENCLEYLKLSIVEVHFISMPASVGDIEHGLCIKMLYRRGENTWIRWLRWQKNPIHLRHRTFLFRFNHSFFHLRKGGSQCWLILRTMSENFWKYSLKHAAKIYVAQISGFKREGNFYKSNFCRRYSNSHLRSWAGHFGESSQSALAALASQQGPWQPWEIDKSHLQLQRQEPFKYTTFVAAGGKELWWCWHFAP